MNAFTENKGVFKLSSMRYLLMLCTLIYSTLQAQQIVNYVFVGDKGVTTNIDEAHSFIIVKKYGERFQRLDYKINAPLVKERNYSDSSLSILEGNFNLYNPDGTLIEAGKYKNNLKDGSWYRFNESKIILEEKFEGGTLVSTITDFSPKKDSAKPASFKDEREAVYGRGNNDWVKYLKRNLNAKVGLESINGGNVYVQFIIDTDGKIQNIYLKKSVEYVLDEEAKRVIEKSPDWQPAFQNSHSVKAYRIQPISFVK